MIEEIGLSDDECIDSSLLDSSDEIEDEKPVLGKRPQNGAYSGREGEGYKRQHRWSEN